MIDSFGQFLRHYLAKGWIVGLFAFIYLISQIIIGRVLEEIGGPVILELQVTGFTAADYVVVFQQWTDAGLMAAYKAHFIFDDLHPIWYAVLMTSTMAVLMNRAACDDGWSKYLVLPIIAGICDMIENGIQHVFLADPSFALVIDPLPAISTIMSITKWALAATSIGLTIRLALKGKQA